MTGEAGDYVVTYPRYEISEKKLGKKQRKLLKKAAERQREAEDALAKAATLATDADAAMKADGSLVDSEVASFHAGEALRHRRKAKAARAGHGVVTLAHGEALARRHDASAAWHEKAVRQAGGSVGNPGEAVVPRPFPGI